MLMVPLLISFVGCADAEDPGDSDPAVQTVEQELFWGGWGRGGVDRERKKLEKRVNRAIRTNGGKQHFKLPFSWQLGRIPQDPLNPLNPAKIFLGRLLYHETAILVDNVRPEGEETASCASCHFVDADFRTFRRQGIGEGGQGFFDREIRPGYAPAELDVQPIRTPTTLNTAYQDVMLWNGQFGATGTNAGTQASWTPGTPIATNNLGYQGLEIQAIAGLGVHRMSFENSRVAGDPTYLWLFDLAFPEISTPDRYNDEHAGLAIAAYERTLLSNLAPFQRYLRGNRKALSDQELRGAELFFGKANCVSCHTGPSLASMSFHALGMNDLEGADVFNVDASVQNRPEQLGRGGFTGDPADNYKFKTPTLYNLYDGNFFGHGANFTSVREVIEYKNAAVPENSLVPVSQLAAEFVPLGLTTSEIDDLTAFVGDALKDPYLDRYEPNWVPSGNCVPTNDPLARAELGCN